MDEKFIDIRATPKLMPHIVALAEEYGLEASEPMAVDSTSDALDAPLGVDEIRQVLEVVTLVATTGTSMVGFVAALKALLKSFEEDDGSEPQAALAETRSQKEIATVTADSDISNLDL